MFEFLPEPTGIPTFECPTKIFYLLDQLCCSLLYLTCQGLYIVGTSKGVSYVGNVCLVVEYLLCPDCKSGSLFTGNG